MHILNAKKAVNNWFAIIQNNRNIKTIALKRKIVGIETKSANKNVHLPILSTDLKSEKTNNTKLNPINIKM